MEGGQPELLRIIREEICARGPISFARFMDLALYHPDYGYYASGRAKIGRGGDYFTNVSVGPLFGRLLATQFAEVWERLGAPSVFTIIEQGAGDGSFAGDVLSELSRSEPACFGATNYVIDEPFAFWRERQHETLASFDRKIRWVSSIEQVDAFVGLHFSNELFDALPVHLVVSEANEEVARWNEQLVSFAQDRFEFVTAPLTNPQLQSHFDRVPALPKGFRTEISLAAPKLISQITRKLSDGVILAIDYGFPRTRFYSPECQEGTLQIRSRHRKLVSPFEAIGQADISAHVDWTSLADAATDAGAMLLGFGDQYHFFTGLISRLPVDQLTAVNKTALRTLFHPELLGRTFQVLAMGKNLPGSLSGFRFTRDAHAELAVG